MSPDSPLSTNRPTQVRYQMVLITMVVAILLYLDRICLSIAGSSIQLDLGLSKPDLDWVLAAFYLTYAFAQIPAGWLGDRLGARWMLTAYLILWSTCTGLSGVVTGMTGLLIVRLGCGLFEAGAYPVAAGVVHRWVPAKSRGLASGVIAVGGRIGGVIAPVLTIWLMIQWAGGSQPEELKSSWRPVMMLYGLIGIVVAIIFWLIYRDRPRQHYAVNAAEVALIEGDHAHQHTVKPLGMPPIPQMVSDRSLWAMSFVQFASNFAWAFLVTKLPAYLKDVHDKSIQTSGLYQSLPLLTGIAGLLFGGYLTDWINRRTGLRWSRGIPSLISRTVVGLMFLACMQLEVDWQVLVALGIIGFATDMATPGVWAYGQDVGGRHVGSVVGWSNMIGNLGAFASPLIMGWITYQYIDVIQGWKAAFLFCAVMQIAAAIASLFIDARKPLVPEVVPVADRPVEID